MKVRDFNPARDIPDLTGKVILVTGGTSGIGAESVSVLAQHNPAHIYFSGRNVKSADALIEKVKSTSPATGLTFIECDLSSLASVQSAAEKFKSLSSRLDILMCNAGVLGLPPDLSKDGYEIQFATNHLGHALLIKLLLPTLNQTAEQPGADVRIISLSSQASMLAPKGGILFSSLQSKQRVGMLGSWSRYGQSKLAILLYARQLAARYPQILTVSVHPGVVKTSMTGNASLANRFIIKSSNPFSMLEPSQGAYNSLWAATTNRKNLVPGEYYEPVGEGGKGMRHTKNEKLATQLWDWTQKQLESFPA